MRAFDNWNSYLDNDGNLLHGKVRFCRKGTTDNIIIYNSDGIAIRNPEFTDMLGRTEYQVFVKNDENVTAYFYKYVGTGDMMQWPGEDYDPSRWAYQYSSDNMDPTSAIDITSDTANGVATMTDLRAVDPDEVPSVNGAKLMWLYGYYNAGDTSPVLYVWDSASLDSDDGGATIMSNHIPGKGRWKLSTRELHFDVRHFGIFPLDDKYSTDYSYTSQLANCAAYLDKEGLDAWFPAINNNMSYYLYDGTNTFAIKGDIYVSDAVRFQVKSGTTGTIITCHELHKRTPNLFDSSVQNGSATLTADWVNISWVGGNCMGDARVGWVIDSSSFSRVIKDKEVRFITNGSSSLQLDNCVITSNKQITGEILIQNSILKTEFFADDYYWGKLTSINNDIRLVNCKDANTYVILKNKQHDPNYGDLGELTLKDATLLPNALAENATFENVTLTGNTELHNVSGTATVSGSAYDLNFVDCWISFMNTTNVTLRTIQWRRGSIYCGAQVQVLTALYVFDADVGAPLYTPGAFVRMERCSVNSPLNGKAVVCKDCQINAAITTSETDAKINFNFDGCYFGPNGTHVISSSTPNTSVVGAWTNNFAETQHPIQINMLNLVAADSGHPYTYSGNSGKFMQRYPVSSYTQGSFWRVNEVARELTAIKAPVLCMPGLVLQPTHNEWFNGVWIPESWAPELHFFAIGIAMARIRLTVTFTFTNTTEMNDSMAHRVNHRMSVSSDMMVSVGDSYNYTVTEFGQKMIGSIFLGPKNFTYPAEITTQDPSTWPQTNSAHITIERLL